MVHVILTLAFVYPAAIMLRRNNKYHALLFSFAVVFLFAALRYGYGNDYFGYEEIHSNAQRGVNSAGIEPLFFALNQVAPSFQLLIAALSCIYLCATYLMIARTTDGHYVLLSILIFLINPYLFLMSLSAVRQTLVLSLFILGLMLSTKSKLAYIASIMMITVVSCFVHQTAVLLLPFYFVFNMKRRLKFDYLFFGLVPVLLLLPTDLFMNLVQRIVQLFSNNLNYLYYIQTNTPNSLRSTLLFAVFYLYVLLNLKLLDDRTYPFAKLYLFGLLFALLAYKLSMFGRLLMYFEIFSVVAIPAIIKANLRTLQTPARRWIHAYGFPMAILTIYLLRYYSFFTTDLWSHFFVYQTILFH